MSEREESGPRKIIGDWWAREIGDRQSSPARALAARLRRATPVEALSEPAVHRLAARLNTRDPERLHRVVTVLVRLREDGRKSLPRKLGEQRQPGAPYLRFQRLLRAEGEALTTALIRALPMVNNACDVGALGADLFFWNDATRVRWSFDYFGATAPESLEETSE